MTGRILKSNAIQSHVCEFGLAHGGKMGICGRKPVAIVDERYFCRDCVSDAIMRFDNIVLFDQDNHQVNIAEFLKLI